MSTQQTLARLLGVDQKNIKQLPAISSNLLQRGVIVTLHVGRWRARRTLGLDDLGIGDKQQSDLISLGQKLLLPKEIIQKLQSIETAARNFLKTKTTLTPFGYFVSVDSYQYIKDGMEKYRAQYMAQRDEIVAQYDEIKTRLLDEYKRVAATAYSRKVRLEGDRVSEDGQQLYTGQFLKRIDALVPSKQEIEQSFKFDLRLCYIPLPSMLSGGGDPDLLALLKAEGEFEAETTMDIVSDVSIQLRDRIIDTLENVLETISTKGKLHPRSVASLQNLVETVGRLNWAGDFEVKVMLARVQAIVGQAEASSAELAAQINNVLTVARATAIELGAEPRQSRLAQVADVPSVDVVRAARLSLGLDDISTETIGPERGTRML